MTTCAARVCYGVPSRWRSLTGRTVKYRLAVEVTGWTLEPLATWPAAMSTRSINVSGTRFTCLSVAPCEDAYRRLSPTHRFTFQRAACQKRLPAALVPPHCLLWPYQYDAVLEQVPPALDALVHVAVHVLQELVGVEAANLEERDVHHDVVHQALEQLDLRGRGLKVCGGRGRGVLGRG